MSEENPRSRWEQFSEVELQVIVGSLGAVCSGIIENGAAKVIADEDRADAASTLLVAGELLFNVGDFKGETHPSMTDLVVVAKAIAEGEAPSHLGEAA